MVDSTIEDKKLGFKEFSKISIPIMLSMLSANILILSDRYIVSLLSTEAMIAVAAALAIISVFQYGSMMISGASVVFVGRSATETPSLVGPYVWQLIWFSIFLTPIFAAVGFFLPLFIFDDSTIQLAGSYFLILMVFCSIFPLQATLAGFFIGIGRFGYFLSISVGTNILNIVLDYVLVFGVDGVISGFGVSGAAIATVFSQALCVFLLFIEFIKTDYAESFSTNDRSIDRSKMKEVLYIAIPTSVGRVVEIFAWAVIFMLVGTMGALQITVFVIFQNIYLFLTFLIEGMYRASLALTSQLLGEDNRKLILKMFKSAMLFNFIITVLLFIILSFTVEGIASLFLNHGSLDSITVIEFVDECFMLFIGFFFFYSASWILSATYLADGKPFDILGINTVIAFIFAVIPMHLLTLYESNNPLHVWYILFSYGVVLFFIFLSRFKSIYNPLDKVLSQNSLENN